MRYGPCSSSWENALVQVLPLFLPAQAVLGVQEWQHDIDGIGSPSGMWHLVWYLIRTYVHVSKNAQYSR